MGIRNSLRTSVRHENRAIYFSGFPCHILHSAAWKLVEAFTKCCTFDLEQFSEDLIYYSFEKSTKQKNQLLSYGLYCEQEYRSII